MSKDGIDVGGNSTATMGWATFLPVRMTPAGERSVPAQAGPSLDEADDRSLVQSFIDGRADAFDEIVRRHQRQIYLVCYRFTGNHDDAADIAQDVFIRAYKGLARFKQESSLSTWLYRIAVNTCLNHAVVRRPRTEPVDAVDRIDPNVRGAHEAIERAETRHAVQQAIRRLPPKQRMTVILRVYQELSHEEIARVLGGTVGASKTNFFHALANLRRLLAT